MRALKAYTMGMESNQTNVAPQSHSKMINRTLGTLLVLVIVVIIIMVLTSSHNAKISSEIASTTSQTTTSTVTQTTTTVYVPPTYTTVDTNGQSIFPGGIFYRNPVYNFTLSLPATWNGYSITNGSATYAGVSIANSIQFNRVGINIFTINAFSKQQWNNIRNQESHSGISSFGEGSYLGENADTIFSAITNSGASEVQSILNTVRF
jgi:hypothetical protein